MKYKIKKFFSDILLFFKNMGLKKFLILILGCLLYSIGTTIFIKPCGLIFGSGTGFSFWLQSVTKIDSQIWLWIINITLLIISFIFAGFNFSMKSLLATFVIPGINMIIQCIVAACGKTTNPTTATDPACLWQANEIVLTVIFGAVFAGAGVILCFIAGGSTGGFTIIQGLLLKYAKVNLSLSLYIISAIIIALGMITFVPNSMFDYWYQEGIASLALTLLQGLIIESVTVVYKKRKLKSIDID